MFPSPDSSSSTHARVAIRCLLTCVAGFALGACALPEPSALSSSTSTVDLVSSGDTVYAQGFTHGDKRTFTIFCHGTGGHRHGRDLELISELGAAYWGRGETNDENAFYRQHYQKTFLILDGPGTTNMPATSGGEPIGLATLFDPRHAMPGDFVPNTLDKPLKLTGRVSDTKLKKTFFLAQRGEFMGDGWDDNVAHALFVLDHLKEQGRFPERINLAGWSRGSVTCLKLANAIEGRYAAGRPFYVQKDLTKGYAADNLRVFYPALSKGELVSPDAIEINMFLIDPVPGRFGADGLTFGSDRSDEIFPPDEQDYQVIPGMVRRCIITLANDEQREGFAPLDADDIRVLHPERSSVVWLPFPGIHSTQVRMEPRDPDDFHNVPPVRDQLTAVPHLAWDLAWRFMTTCGTRFERNLIADEKFGGRLRTPQEICELYSNVWNRKEMYHQARNRGLGQRIMGGLMPRLYTGYPFAGREFWGKNPLQLPRHRKDLFTAEFGVYVEHPGFFINEHHRWCFQRAYPSLYRHLFTLPTVEKPVPSSAAAELKTIRQGSPELWRQLERCGVQELESCVMKTDAFRRGEPLRKNREALPPRFAGQLDRMGLKL